MLGSALLAGVFSRTGLKLGRFEGLVLCGAFIAFAILSY